MMSQAACSRTAPFPSHARSPAPSVEELRRVLTAAGDS
jgi:hypothetical protein